MDGLPNTHVDTWAMAFTPDYDPEFNRCTAYLTNDGGVFAHFVGCTITGGWVRAMSGLHVMYSDTMAGSSRPASQCGRLRRHAQLCIFRQATTTYG